MELKALTLLMVVVAINIDRSHTQQQGITTVTTECNRQLDLVFMIDASNSVRYDNFFSQITTIRDVANSMDIRPNALRVGLVVFSNSVRSYPLTDNKPEIAKAIGEMDYLDRGTYTHLGIDQAVLLYNNKPRAADVPKLLMIITDGSSVNQTLTLAAASRAKSQGITIYALGISQDVNRVELEAMATSPDRVMYTPNFNDIKTVLQQAIRRACSLVVIPPPLIRTPPPTFPTRPAVVTNHLCANSGSMTNGYGYVAHPAECDMYIQCYYNPTTALHIGVVRHCGIGLHWNRRTKSCDDPKEARCPFDPCKTDCEPYHMADSSRAYWTCENKVSTAKCCGEYESFVQGKGCVKNMMCMEKCAIGQCLKGMCMRRPVWNMPAMYQHKQLSGYLGWISEPCVNTEFDLLTCDCSASSDHMCFPDFETNLNSASSLGQYVRADNAQLNGAGAVVGQGSNLHINLHKTKGDEPVTVTLGYRENTLNTDNTEILMATSDCSSTKGSFHISYSNKYVVAHMMSAYGQYAKLSLPTDGFSANDVKELTFTYNNKYMAMSVKVGQIEYMQTTKAPMGVNFGCGFDIGATTRHTGFNGLIQKIAIYSCSLNRLY